MKKHVIVVFILIVVAAITYVLLLRGSNDSTTSPIENQQNQSSNSSSTYNDNQDQEFPSEEGPKLYIGNPDAEVIITEFIDYKCPNCNTFHRTVKNQIEEEYGNSVAFEIHQTPFIGPDSGRAARGAYCSEIHGSVFESYNDKVFAYMYDNYYAQQNFQSEFEDILTAEILSALYQEAGGNDEAGFQNCIVDTDTINRYINADQLLAAEKEVRGTPSFVVGDTSLIGPQQFSVFKALIEAEL